MPTVEWEATAGDWGKIFPATLADKDGPVDMTGVLSLVFELGVEGQIPLVTGAGVADPDQVNNKGDVTYTFTEGQLDDIEEGFYEVVWIATWSNARLTFPTDPRTQVKIKAQLAAA